MIRDIDPIEEIRKHPGVTAGSLAALVLGAAAVLYLSQRTGPTRYQRIKSRMDPRGWVGCASAIAGTDFYTPTAGLTLPTLAIAGANDGTTPPDLVRETAELILGSRFHLIRGAGHLPMVEKPEEYAALLGEFLRSIGHV